MFFSFLNFFHKQRAFGVFSKKIIAAFLIILLFTAAFQNPALAGGGEYFAGAPDAYDTFEEIEIAGDNIQNETDMLIFIACVSAYAAVLLLLLILIITRRKRRKVKALVVLAVLWLAAGAALAALGLWAAKDEVYPVYVEGAEYEEQDYEPYELSAGQQEIIDGFGDPDGFVIMYVDGDRLETWYYYEAGFVLDFLGGIEIERENDSGLTEKDVQSTDYRPEDFACAMTPGTALSAADMEAFTMVPLEEELLEDGKLYYGEGIVLGFYEDELYYVETLLPED